MEEQIKAYMVMVKLKYGIPFYNFYRFTEDDASRTYFETLVPNYISIWNTESFHVDVYMDGSYRCPSYVHQRISYKEVGIWVLDKLKFLVANDDWDF